MPAHTAGLNRELGAAANGDRRDVLVRQLMQTPQRHLQRFRIDLWRVEQVAAEDYEAGALIDGEVDGEAEAVSESAQVVEPEFELVDEAQSALAAALDRLPHDQREVLVMKIWNELTFAEIASALGISQNTAASRYRYALAALKKIFQPQ